MKKQPCFRILNAVFLAVTFLGINYVRAQAPDAEISSSYYKVKPDYYTIPPISSDIQMISYRIASAYGADPQTVESYVHTAVDLEAEIGIAAPVVIAIAIHESTFSSPLFKNSGNPFGIKAGQLWEGPVYHMMQGNEEVAFRIYSTPEEALLDFGQFIRSRPWYADALECSMDDFSCVVEGLKKTETEPGYSLNPYWDEAILGIIEKIQLQSLAAR